MTQTVTHTGCGAGGDNGAKRAGTDTGLEQTGWKYLESTRKGVPTAAHNPEVVGSNPASATIKTVGIARFRRFSLLFELFIHKIAERLPHADRVSVRQAFFYFHHLTAVSRGRFRGR